jgi:hypothetical protein
METGYMTLTVACGKIYELSGNPMASSTLGEILASVFPERIHGKVWKLSIDHVRIVAIYWAEWGRRNKRPLLAHWALDHKFIIPPEFSPPVIVKVKKISAPVDHLDDRRLERLIDKKVEEAVAKRISLQTAPAKAQISQVMNATRGRENDPRLLQIDTKIGVFVNNEPIKRADIWNYVRKRFEEENSIKVDLHGNQTFPQWLRSEGWVDVFAQQYKTYLDELHDNLACGQGKLSL